MPLACGKSKSCSPSNHPRFMVGSGGLESRASVPTIDHAPFLGSNVILIWHLSVGWSNVNFRPISGWSFSVTHFSTQFAFSSVKLPSLINPTLSTVPCGHTAAFRKAALSMSCGVDSRWDGS